MSVGRVLLFSILLSYIICGDSQRLRRETSSYGFIQQFRNIGCQYIGNNFDKLKGDWYYVVRIVNPETPPARCGNLTVHETSENGFSSELTYIGSEDERITVSFGGKFVTDVAVEINNLPNLISRVSDWTYPFNVEIIICGDVFFIEPLYYYGGTMVFTRQIPNDMKTFTNKFWTPLEIDETVLRKRVRRDCLNG